MDNVGMSSRKTETILGISGKWDFVKGFGYTEVGRGKRMMEVSGNNRCRKQLLKHRVEDKKGGFRAETVD